MKRVQGIRSNREGLRREGLRPLFSKDLLCGLCGILLSACLVLILAIPQHAYAEDERLESSSTSEEEQPFILLPFISSPELLKNLIDEGDVLNGSSLNETFDFNGTYDGEFISSEGYEQLYSIVKMVSDPDKVVALVKDAATLLLADCNLRKTGDASNTVEAVTYGLNAIITAVGQSSYGLVLNSNLSSSAAASPAFAAMDRAIILAQNVAIQTTRTSSYALEAAYGGTILANEIAAELTGENSPALCVGAGEGYISLANSTLNTEGNNSPLASSDGRVEMDNVLGESAASQLAWIHDAGALLVHGSKLESQMTNRDDDDPEANAITIYRDDPVNLETLTEDALFQATDSALSSSLKSGSFFYLTNTRAKILLSNTVLDFDDSAVRLLTATGNNRNNWGTTGANGVSATFTASNQELNGDIVVDSQSSVDFYLLDGSMWRGSAQNLSSSQNILASDKLDVSVERGSTWMVTKNSTVTTLNLANGARLIDVNGKSVRIADSNGMTLVDGGSDITITVTGGFSTSVKRNADNQLQDYVIDRTALDESFGLVTSYGSNASSAYTPEELRVLEMSNRLRNWFREL